MELSGKSLITPLPPAISTLSPIFRCPEMPAWPPILTFLPNNDKNIRYPHIGIVQIEDNCEIGSGATIDRGSMSNTVIGKNTFLDNQIHIAHNVKIGENGIIAGQVGIAGSSIIGKNVKIGGLFHLLIYFCNF